MYNLLYICQNLSFSCQLHALVHADNYLFDKKLDQDISLNFVFLSPSNIYINNSDHYYAK